MTRFVVMTGPGHQGSRALLIRDRFSWGAIFLPSLWLLRHRLFLAAVAVLLLQAAAAVVGQRVGMGGTGLAVAFLIAIAVALEGPRLRIARARRKGLNEVMFIEAATQDEAELVYFDSDTEAGIDEDDAFDSEPVRRRLPMFGWRSGRSLLATAGGR